MKSSRAARLRLKSARTQRADGPPRVQPGALDRRRNRRAWRLHREARSRPCRRRTTRTETRDQADGDVRLGPATTRPFLRHQVRETAWNVLAELPNAGGERNRLRARDGSRKPLDPIRVPAEALEDGAGQIFECSSRCVSDWRPTRNRFSAFVPTRRDSNPRHADYDSR